MRVLLFMILIAVLLFPFFKSLKDKSVFYQFPFLISLTTIGFILPTLIFKLNDNYSLSDTEYNLFVLNMILCLTAGYLGYKKKYSYYKLSNKNYELNSIILAVSPFVFISFYIFIFLIDVKGVGGYTEGYSAIYIYLSRLMRPAAVIVFFIFLISKKKYALFLFILYLIVSLNLIVIAGRRSEVFILAVTILFPLFFVKKFIPSKKLSIIIGSLMLIAFLIMPSIRVHTKKGQFNKIQNISFTSVIQDYYFGQKTNEIVEAAINMKIIQENNGYSYGARWINNFTNQFVSSTLFGRDIKKSTEIKTFDLQLSRNSNYKNSDYKDYLPPTGFGDVFYDFSWFGCIVFFIWGRISKKLWTQAYYSKDIFNKMFYSYFVTMIFLSVYDSLSFVPTNIILGLVTFSIVKKLTKITWK